MARDITSVSDLIPDERNANIGTARGRTMLEHSLRHLGAGKSVVADRNGKLIAGNKTAEEAAALGIEEVIVVRSRGNALIVHQREDLDLDTDERARELAWADNRVAQASLLFDPEQLLADTENGLDLSAYFTGTEMDDLLARAEQEVILPPQPTSAYHMDNPFAERAEAQKAAAADPNAPLTTQPAGVRVMQFYLTVEQHEAMATQVRELAQHFETTTVTDTFIKVVQYAFDAIAGAH